MNREDCKNTTKLRILKSYQELNPLRKRKKRSLTQHHIDNNNFIVSAENTYPNQTCSKTHNLKSSFKNKDLKNEIQKALENKNWPKMEYLLYILVTLNKEYHKNPQIYQAIEETLSNNSYLKNLEINNISKLIYDFSHSYYIDIDNKDKITKMIIANSNDYELIANINEGCGQYYFYKSKKNKGNDSGKEKNWTKNFMYKYYYHGTCCCFQTLFSRFNNKFIMNKYEWHVGHSRKSIIYKESIINFAKYSIFGILFILSLLYSFNLYSKNDILICKNLENNKLIKVHSKRGNIDLDNVDSVQINTNSDQFICHKQNLMSQYTSFEFFQILFLIYCGFMLTKTIFKVLKTIIK